MEFPNETTEEDENRGPLLQREPSNATENVVLMVPEADNFDTQGDLDARSENNAVIIE